MGRHILRESTRGGYSDRPSKTLFGNIDAIWWLPYTPRLDMAQKIVHLHGYWRGSDTLHTPAQLTTRRRRLTASLQRLLTRHSVVVISCGGWDPSLTAQRHVAMDTAPDLFISHVLPFLLSPN